MRAASRAPWSHDDAKFPKCGLFVQSEAESKIFREVPRVLHLAVVGVACPRLYTANLQQKAHTHTPCPDPPPHCYGHPNPTGPRPALLPDGTLYLHHALSTNILNLQSQKSIMTSLKKAQHPPLGRHGYQPHELPFAGFVPANPLKTHTHTC